MLRKPGSHSRRAARSLRARRAGRASDAPRPCLTVLPGEPLTCLPKQILSGPVHGLAGSVESYEGPVSWIKAANQSAADVTGPDDVQAEVSGNLMRTAYTR